MSFVLINSALAITVSTVLTLGGATSPALAWTGTHGMLQRGRMLAPGLHQLTGTHLVPGQTVHQISDLPDPSPPYIAADGAVEIYGTTNYYLRYRNWKEFERAGEFEILPLPLFLSNGTSLPAGMNQPWDIRKFRVITAGGGTGEILVGSTMSPSHGRPAAVWPDDNFNRRIFFFRQDAHGRWIRDEVPVVGNPATGWFGHSYGGNFFQLGGPDWNTIDLRPGAFRPLPIFFYEKVDDPANAGPSRTELYAQRISSFERGQHLAGPEGLVLSIGDPPFPATRRTTGGHLIEGPRVSWMRIENRIFYIMAFSSGDFPTDGYSMNYAWSRRPEGPYLPMLTSDGRDLLDLGTGLKRTFQLSWVGRPAFFPTPDGNYEVIFDGVSKRILPDNDYSRWPTRYGIGNFFRITFKSTVQTSVDADGRPVLRLGPPGRHLRNLPREGSPGAMGRPTSSSLSKPR